MIQNHINIDSFESVFREVVLKKGYSIFNRNKIVLDSGSGDGNYRFHINNKHPYYIDINRRGNLIQDYHCTCNKKELCEHLCAAVFYLSQDKLLFKNKLRQKSRKSKDESEIQYNELCKKLRKYLTEYFSSENKKAAQNRKESDEMLKGLVQKFNTVEMPVLYIALLNELSNFYKFKNDLNASESKNPLEEIAEMSEVYKIKGLSQYQKQIWLITLKDSLRNSKKFNSNIFIFLLPAALNMIDKVEELEELKALLHKRKSKYNYKQYFDRHLIATFAIDAREKELLNNKIKWSHSAVPERSVACAALKFSSNKIKQAFTILCKDLVDYKKSKPENYVTYLNYMYEKAEKYGYSNVELEVINELIRFQPGAALKYIKQIHHLLPEKAERNEYIEKILSKLKRQPDLYFTDTANILEFEERYDELIKEISKHPNKFMLLNRIMIKKLPLMDEFSLKVYRKELVNVFYEARESYHQLQIFEKARDFIQKLPATQALELLTKLAEEISKNNFMYNKLIAYRDSLKISLQG